MCTGSRGRTSAWGGSGGKSKLSGITKRGDTYLRTSLIQGAKSAVMTAHRRQDRISAWANALRERSGWQKAVVALANKNARILWAVMTRGDAFDPNRLSVKPTGWRDQSNFLARREDEDALNRSDRQQANSANPWWLRHPEFHAIGMEAPLSGSHLGPHHMLLQSSVQQDRL